MNDQFDELIQELANMRPAQPARRLAARIEQKLDCEGPAPASPPGVLSRTWLSWLPLAAAATLMLGIVAIALRHHQTATPSDQGLNRSAVTSPHNRSMDSAEPSLHLVHNVNYLIDAEDTGLIDAPTPVPLRKVKWQFVSASEFRDRRDNAVVRVFVPREETVLIPVAIH